MSDIYDRLGSQLMHAATTTLSRPVTRFARLRGWRRRRLVVVLCTGVVAAGGTAAATAPWHPVLGRGGDDAPKPASSAVPGDQSALLGVLRRPQREEDRAPDVEEQLKRLMANTDRGIRLDYVRRLANGPFGRDAVVLIPKESFGEDSPAVARPAVKDALCVYYPNTTESGKWISTAITCWGSEQIRQGRANSIAPAGNSFHLYGLVPDDVATVAIKHRDGSTARVAVRNNFFDLAGPAVDPGSPASPTDVAPDGPLLWFDSSGTAVEHPAGGAPVGER